MKPTYLLARHPTDGLRDTLLIMLPNDSVNVIPFSRSHKPADFLDEEAQEDGFGGYAKTRLAYYDGYTLYVLDDNGERLHKYIVAAPTTNMVWEDEDGVICVTCGRTGRLLRFSNFSRGLVTIDLSSDAYIPALYHGKLTRVA